MFSYIYYGYAAYTVYKYSYLLEYGYVTVHYMGKIYTWIAPHEENASDIERDWILCDVDEPDVIVLD